MSDFKTSLDEYTEEERQSTGNMMYGGKRHDEICDYLQKTFNFNESQINDISMGIWMAIESEKRVQEVKIDKLKYCGNCDHNEDGDCVILTCSYKYDCKRFNPKVKEGKWEGDI